MSSSEVWTQRPGNAFDLLFKEPSFLDDSPGLQTLKDIVSYKGSIARRFTVTAVDTNTGDTIAMSQDNTTYEDLA